MAKVVFVANGDSTITIQRSEGNSYSFDLALPKVTRNSEEPAETVIETHGYCAVTQCHDCTTINCTTIQCNAVRCSDCNTVNCTTINCTTIDCSTVQCSGRCTANCLECRDCNNCKDCGNCRSDWQLCYNCYNCYNCYECANNK